MQTIHEPRGSVSDQRVFNLSRHEGHERLYQDYFCENLVYITHLYCRRFCMSHPLLCHIVAEVMAHNEYFHQIPDVVECLGLQFID